MNNEVEIDEMDKQTGEASKLDTMEDELKLADERVKKKGKKNKKNE